MVKNLSSYFLWWLSSWFLISKGIFKSIKKTLSTWPSLAAPTLFMTEAAETGPKQRIQGHIKPPPPPPHDQWTDSIRETKWPCLAFAVPSPPPRDWDGQPFPTPWQVSSGTELDDDINQDSKPHMEIITTVTGFLCEYSGLFGGAF